MPQPTPRNIEYLERELARCQFELDESYREVGRMLLETVECEGKRVGKLVDTIVDLRQQLALARREQPCPTCGGANSPGCCYCGHCGRYLDHENREESPI